MVRDDILDRVAGRYAKMPRVTFAGVKGDEGVSAPVLRRLQTYMAAGGLPLTLDAIRESYIEHKHDGLTGCQSIALALLVDLHNAGEGAGWVLHSGVWKDHGGPHAWLESGGVAVDASPIIDGEPVIMVMSAKPYRRITQSVSQRQYTAGDVPTGRYDRMEAEAGRIYET